MADETKGRYRQILEVLATNASSGMARDWIAGVAREADYWPELWLPPGAAIPTAPARPPPTSASREGQAPRPAVSFEDEARPIRKGRDDAGGTDLGDEGVPEGASTGDLAPQLSGAAALLMGGLESGVQELGELRADARVRARASFWAALGFALVGAATLVIGAALALTTLVAPGVVTAVVGPLVNGSLGGMLWKLHQRTTEDLGDLTSDIRSLRDTGFAVWITAHIEDPRERDEALARLARGLQARGRQSGRGGGGSSGPPNGG